jgi:hypothetical protein
MTFIVATLLAVLAILAAAIAGLLVQRRALRERYERVRLVHKGLGLVSMSERARLIGGTVRIVSGLNQGTQVQATIPTHARVKMNVGSGMEGQPA